MLQNKTTDNRFGVAASIYPGINLDAVCEEGTSHAGKYQFETVQDVDPSLQLRNRLTGKIVSSIHVNVRLGVDSRLYPGVDLNEKLPEQMIKNGFPEFRFVPVPGKETSGQLGDIKRAKTIFSTISHKSADSQGMLNDPVHAAHEEAHANKP